MRYRREFPPNVTRRINEILCEEANRVELLLSDLVIGERADKRKRVVRARHRAVLRMRREIWQKVNPRNRSEISYVPTNVGYADGWQPLSAPALSAIFGCDHTTIVCIMNREKQANAKAKPKANAVRVPASCESMTPEEWEAK